MFCPNCGSSVRDGAAFCPACGNPMSIQQGGQQQYNQQTYDQQQYNQQSYDQQYNQPYNQVNYGQPASSGGGPVRDDREIVTYVLLTVITCGIYGYWYIYQLAQDANTMCAGDGEETPGLLIYVLLSIVTCGIYSIYWEYKLANRLSAYAPRYGIHIQESGSDVLTWRLLGYLICGLATFVGTHILFKIANQLAAGYNSYYGYTYTTN